MTKIIAELGINHNGSIDTLLAMTRQAKDAGADYVKLQKRDVDICYTVKELRKPCESPWGNTVDAKVRGRELLWDDIAQFADYCDSIGVGWGCSCFDLNSMAQLFSRFGSRVAFNKIPSAMSIHDTYVWLVAQQGIFTIISCGLSNGLTDIQKIADVFEDVKTPYVVNVTTSVYPCPLRRCNLYRIDTLKTMLSDMSYCQGVGYSGHEVGILPSVIAAWSGAEWIERHFTLDRSSYGADQSASLEPEGLRRLVRDIRSLDIIGGDADIRLYGDEKNPVPELRNVKGMK
jgi:N-acetylneuraminate synthase